MGETEQDVVTAGAGIPPPDQIEDERTLALFESAPNGVAALGPDLRLRIANTALARMLGYEVPELKGRAVADLSSSDSRPIWLTMQADLAREGSGSVRRALTGLRRDGTEFPMDVVLTPFRGSEAGAMLMIVVDATDRRRAEERQHLLIGELHHRTQNVFAVIQSVASRTFTGDRSLGEAKQIFIDRLHALARTYTVLTEGSWEGAPIDRILRDELAPFSTRVAMQGEPVMIQPSAAQTLAMIFHELATNAIRHGALSAPKGHLEIAWWTGHAEHGPELSFVWKEHDGPPVALPARKGYGRTILEDGARHIGKALITYAPAGLRYELTAPLSAIGWSARANVPFGNPSRMI